MILSKCAFVQKRSKVLQSDPVDGRIVNDSPAYLHPGMTQERIGTVSNHDVRPDPVGAQQPRRNYRTLQA
jgi:hypothetical protein